MDRAGCMSCSSMTRKPDRGKASRPMSEDAGLWQQLTQAVKPLHPETRTPRAARKPAAKPIPEIAKPAPAVAPRPPPPALPSLPVVRKRVIAGLDQRKADR